jgi:hypothetical protein
VYRNLTSQYTIPRKIALARIISEMANILFFNIDLILVSIYTKCNRY